jgi:Spy/CpxP family protein refolding chaperone
MKTQWILPLCLALAVPAALAQQNDATPPAGQPGAPAPQQHTMHMEHHAGPEQGHFMMVHHDGPEGPMSEHGGMSMHHHGMEHGDWWKNPMMAQHIGLTPEQVKKLDSISLAGQIEIIHLRAALEEQEVTMHASMDDAAAAFDQKKADLEIDKLADAHAALEKTEAKLHVSERAVLTPDQWTKMHTPMEHHMGQPGNWHHAAPQAPGAGPA